MTSLILALVILSTMSVCFLTGQSALLLAIIMCAGLLGEVCQSLEERRTPMLPVSVALSCFTVWTILALAGVLLGQLSNWPM